MLARFFLLLILLPLAELALLTWIASHTSLTFVLGWVLVTGAAGVWLVRHQGWQMLTRLRTGSAAGQVTPDALGDRLLILFAGLLLIVPGVLSDVAAVGLLLPLTRRPLKRWLTAHFRSRVATSFRSFGAGVHPLRRDEIIGARVVDGTVVDGTVVDGTVIDGSVADESATGEPTAGALPTPRG